MSFYAQLLVSAIRVLRETMKTVTNFSLRSMAFEYITENKTIENSTHASMVGSSESNFPI